MRPDETQAAQLDQAGIEVECQRQQLLLAALWQRGEESPHGLAPLLQPLPGPRHIASLADGLAAYRRNAWAGAHRALALAYPVLEALVGTQSLGAIAHALWQADPPVHGDLGQWGAQVANWLASQPETEAHPYLPDLARLEWALHQAGRAADPHPGPPEGLALLADTDPAQLFTRWQPGAALLVSPWPVFSLWQAHQPEPMRVAEEPQRLAAVREAIQAHQGEAVLIWRQQWRAQCRLLPSNWAAMNERLLAGASLGEALERHSQEAEDFQAWLLEGLRENWLQAWYSANVAKES